MCEGEWQSFVVCEGEWQIYCYVQLSARMCVELYAVFYCNQWNRNKRSKQRKARHTAAPWVDWTFHFARLLITWQESAEQLALKGGRALFDVLRLYSRLKQMTCNTFFKIFDSKIQPILLSSSEVWGVLVKNNNPTESVHLSACKRFLNVAAHTPNKMVYGELGRHLLQISCYNRAIKYWFCLLKMDSEHLPKQAYCILTNTDSNGKCNWVSSIRSVLQSLCVSWLHAFEHVWFRETQNDFYPGRSWKKPR